MILSNGTADLNKKMQWLEFRYLDGSMAFIRPSSFKQIGTKHWRNCLKVPKTLIDNLTKGKVQGLTKNELDYVKMAVHMEAIINDLHINLEMEEQAKFPVRPGSCGPPKRPEIISLLDSEDDEDEIVDRNGAVVDNRKPPPVTPRASTTEKKAVVTPIYPPKVDQAASGNVLVASTRAIPAVEGELKPAANPNLDGRVAPAMDHQAFVGAATLHQLNTLEPTPSVVGQILAFGSSKCWIDIGSASSSQGLKKAATAAKELLEHLFTANLQWTDVEGVFTSKPIEDALLVTYRTASLHQVHFIKVLTGDVAVLPMNGDAADTTLDSEIEKAILRICESMRSSERASFNRAVALHKVNEYLTALETLFLPSWNKYWNAKKSSGDDIIAERMASAIPHFKLFLKALVGRN